MKRTSVDSSSILSIGWDNGTLEVEFKRGTYQFFGVPKEIYKAFLRAESIGTYFHKNINKKYSYSYASI